MTDLISRTASTTHRVHSLRHLNLIHQQSIANPVNCHAHIAFGIRELQELRKTKASFEEQSSNFENGKKRKPS